MKRNLPETDTNGALPEQFREHPAAQKKTDVLLDLIRDGRPMTLRQQLCLTVELSVPAIIAQLSSIIMQYIDAAMVGRIGAKASASIGLVSTTTWLFWGLCTAAAGCIGCRYQLFAAGMAGRRCFHPSGCFHFFFIFSIFLPVLQMIFLAGGMLRCSGNMRIPSLLGVIMCVLDVVFNFFLIFPTRGCGHHSCRSEHRSRTEEADP